MSGFAYRLRRIEAVVSTAVGCPTCRDVSPQMRFLDVGDPEPLDQVCPDCGRVCFTIIQVGVQDPDNPGPFYEWVPVGQGRG